MNRVSSQVLEFDRQFIADLMQVPATNRIRLEIVKRALREAIEADLTPRQREMLLMRYFEGKTGSEIAAQLQINPSTVTRTLRRAEENLRRSLRFYVEFMNCSFEEESP